MRTSLFALTALMGLALTACEEDSFETGDEANITSSVCTVKDQRTGKTMTPAALAELNDPIAKKVFATGTCPKTFEEVMGKLRETDAKSCKGERAGIKTRLISERSQQLGVPDAYRAVVSRACDGRGEHELLFSLFGIGFDGTEPPSELPEDVEIIAFDRERGVFSYYTVESGKWTHFGNSKDYIEPDAGKKLRCASCHTSGGLIMKELNQPWVHWEGKMETPGTTALVDQFPAFGTKATGYNLEPTIKKGNAAWNTAKIAHLTSNRKPADVLRPLFCSVQVNIQTTGSNKLPTAVPTDFLFDPSLGRKDTLPITAADYTALLVSNNQRMTDDGGNSLVGKDGAELVDNVFRFAFPERSGEDVDYVSQLITAGIIDADFVKDVLMVDFTRPVFSDARCELLSFAPTTATTPATFRSGFVSKLEAKKPAAGTPAAALLANLKDTADSSKHDSAMATFVSSCKARPKKDLLKDVFTIASARRNRVRERPIMEFAESLPFDDLAPNKLSALDAVTCTLTTK